MLNQPEFQAPNLRLKQHLNLITDKDVASLLGLSARAWCARKRRNRFPVEELIVFARKNPEYKIDIDFILYGTSSLVTGLNIKDVELARDLEKRLNLSLENSQFIALVHFMSEVSK